MSPSLSTVHCPLSTVHSSLLSVSPHLLSALPPLPLPLLCRHPQLCSLHLHGGRGAVVRCGALSAEGAHGLTRGFELLDVGRWSAPPLPGGGCLSVRRGGAALRRLRQQRRPLRPLPPSPPLRPLPPTAAPQHQHSRLHCTQPSPLPCLCSSSDCAALQRYLSSSVSLYCQALAALFPPSLSVVYLCNSGSEANDLALRLCRAHTAAADVLVLDCAYHGHTAAMSDTAHHSAPLPLLHCSAHPPLPLPTPRALQGGLQSVQVATPSEGAHPRASLRASLLHPGHGRVEATEAAEEEEGGVG